MSASPDSLSSSALGRTVLPIITWRMVPFLFLLYIIAYLDRINVGFAALQMKSQLGFSDDIYGLGGGMFFLGYFFFQIPSNLVLQRVGAKRWVAILMVTWGIISSCMMFVRTPASFYALRFALGLAEAGFFPGVIFYLKSWFPADARARTVAWFMTAAALSGVVGGPLSGALLGLHSKGGLSGWQWMFLIEGLPAVVMGFVVLVYLTDKPEHAEWLSDEQRGWLISVLEQERQSVAAHAPVNVSSVFTNINIWILSVVYFGLNTVSYGVSLWLPQMIRDHSKASNFQIGLLAAIPYVAATIAMVLVGQHSDKTGERRLHTSIPALLSATALVAAAYSGNVVLLVAVMTVAVMAQFSMMGPFWAMPTSFLSGTAAATGIALINSIGNMGGFFGSRIIGKLKTAAGDYTGGLLAIAATIALTGILGLWVKTRATQPASKAS